MAKRKTEKDYHDLAVSRGFKWVGKVLPKHTGIRTLWECRNKHRWKTTYSSIQQKSNCPSCYGTVKKMKKDYYNVGIDINVVWASKELPKNTRTRTWWKCLKCGYVWSSKYNYIQQGHGCHVCTKHAKKIKKDYHNLAKTRGFKWIGKKLPKTTNTSTWWECKKGHKWKTRYSKLRQGCSCPICKDMINGVPVSKPQRELNNLLCGSLNYPEGRYRIDVAIMRKSQKIAVEYDCQYWHQGKEKRDAKRDKQLIFRGWKIIHIKSRNLLPTRKQLTDVIGYLLRVDEKVCNVYLEDWRE